MASIANFAVFTRRSSDPSLGWEDNPPNTPVYTYVASAINIALSILESPHGRHYLTQLALIIDHDMDENSHFQGNKDIAEHWVDFFLAKVRAQFPVVIVDFTMNNPDELGCHPRGRWMGHLKDFDPRSHMICINGQRTADMVASARGQDGQNFRNFQFLFATMFTHEVGAHLLVTFLRNGRVNTPPTITVQGYGSRTVGESGRFLEAYLFRGTTEYYRAASQDMHQTGIPYQIDHQNRAWRISCTTINEICRYEFRFPFIRVGSPVSPRDMRSMGSGSSASTTLESRRAMMARAFDLGRPKGYRVKVSDIMNVARDPRKMLKAC